MFKRSLWITMLLVFLFVLTTACTSNTGSNESVNDGNNGNDDNQGEANNSDDEKIELRMSWWGGQERHDLTLQVIELFEERHPEVKIVAEYSGFDGYFDRLTTQFASGNAPDLIQLGGSVNDYVDRDVLLSLNDYVGSELDTSLIDESAINAATFNGNLYAMSLGTNARGMLLNKSVFDEAGIPLPDDEWTWEDYTEIASQITTSVDGVYGTQVGSPNIFEYFINQRGKVLHVDGELGFDMDDALAWFQLWEDIGDQEGLVPPEIQAAAPEGDAGQSLIVSRDVAMMEIPSNQLGSFMSASEDEFVIHIIPYSSETGINGVPLRPSQHLAVNANTEHPEWSVKFMDFFVNDLEATAILESDRGVPVNSDVRAMLIPEMDEISSRIVEYVDWVSASSDADFIPFFPGYNESGDLFQEIHESISFGFMSVEEGAEVFMDELNAIMARHAD
ncbi:extracellular solute-binding protein [Evansella sp. AB-P1]|uniref:ABC transporter substrate-binding protein n=1 Tax=Evansella sp. AB-P1 TaxID=3037653 RepID=UPI00241C2254|nr:extracellular solute-binding protein [Evansella sp. AB-P1]MDG5789905.1 extracellular solute-binding protein [Evansella sp. AB-P1]